MPAAGIASILVDAGRQAGLPTYATLVSVVSMTASGKTLFVRNLPVKLVREVKASAARRGKTLTAVVEEALARSLQFDEPAVDDAFARDAAWFATQRAKLMRRYRGEYVAVVDQAVADHDPDFSSLARRVFARFGNRGIYMPRVQAEEPVVHVRSPRLVRP